MTKRRAREGEVGATKSEGRVNKQRHSKLGLFAIALGLLVVGCNGAPNAGTGETGSVQANGRPAPQALKVGIVFDSGGRGDKSFNDSAWAGIERAKKEYGITESFVETKDAKDYETNLTAMADKGCDLVVSVGINTKTALEKVARMYPNVKFAIIDASVDAPNVRSLVFKEEEGSFLVGFLAGSVSKTGKVGFVGGMEIPLIKKFQVGYEAGAKTANSSVVVLPAKYTGNWDNADTAKAAANILFGSGADVVYAAAGRAGLGVIRAAKDSGKWAIGVDSDQDYLEPGTVLTSMVKRVDNAVYSTIKDLKEGKFTAGTTVYDLKAGGVGTTEFKYSKDKISPDVLQKLEAVKKQIVDGEVKAPSTPDELAAFQPKPVPAR